MKLFMPLILGCALLANPLLAGDETIPIIQISDQELSGTINVETELPDNYEQGNDKGIDTSKKDPTLTGTVNVPSDWRIKHVYLGASYYGIPGCQYLAAYWGFKQVSYFGPYYVPAYFKPGYWYNGYWLPGYWTGNYTITYCYGVRK